MRVAFLGNDAWSVPSLDALVGAEGIDVALVVTRTPRPAGRGSKLTPTRVAEATRRLDVTLLETVTVRTGDGFATLKEAKADVLVVVAYGEILTREVLDLATPVNLHFSLLPRWRGAAPVQRAILAGDVETGVTVMLMDEGLDTGPILAQRREPIYPNDDGGALGARLASLGGELLVQTLSRLSEIEPAPQSDAGATAAPKLTPPERLIDWSEAADAIVRRVRAFAPAPGATTHRRGHALKVLRAEVAAGAGEPGSILSIDGSGFKVAAGTGAVRPLEVAPAGRRRMTAAEYSRGARLEPGERLG